MKVQYSILLFLFFLGLNCVVEPVKTPCEKGCDTKLALCYYMFSKSTSSSDSTVDKIAPIFLCETLHSTCNNVCYYE